MLGVGVGGSKLRRRCLLRALGSEADVTGGVADEHVADEPCFITVTIITSITLITITSINITIVITIYIYIYRLRWPADVIFCTGWIFITCCVCV